jgi:hypothetical protein
LFYFFKEKVSMEKFFLFGMAVLLSVSLFMLGCSTDSDASGSNPGPSDAEKAAALANELGGSKAEATGTTVTLKDDVSLTKNITVPARVTLNTDEYTLTVNVGLTLTVAGTLEVAGMITGGGTAVTTGLGVVSLANTTPETNKTNLEWVLDKSGETGIAKVTLTQPVTLTGAANVKAGVTLTVDTSGTLTVGETNTVTFAKATITGTAGVTLNGATGMVTLTDTDTLVLADTGTIVVAGTGKVSLPNIEFGVGTYTGGGGLPLMRNRRPMKL